MKTDNINEVLEICAGDTIFVFGNLVQETGTYSQIFPNQNACDSTHTVSVLINEIQATFERITICEGASITVFDQLITEDQQVARTFSGASACDSTHIIQIEVLQTVFSEENISVCASACIDLFGATACANQSFAKTYTGANGCDSVHTLRLDIMGEKRVESYLEICESACIDLYGVTACSDRKLVNNLTASSGCDSVHTLHFTLMDTKETVEEYTLCAGDSIAALGTFIKEAGAFSKHFSAANGCDSLHKVIVHISSPIEAEIKVKPTCENQANGQMELVIRGGIAPYSLIWEGNDMGGKRNIDNLLAGNYEIIILDSFNCQIQQSFQIEELLLPKVEKEVLDLSCFGTNDGSISLFSDEQLSYSLNGQNRAEGLFSNLAPGTYKLSVKNEMGCEVIEHISINEPEPILLDLPEKLTINLGNSIELIPQISGAETVSFNWAESATLSCLDCETPTATPLKNTKI